jgi:rhomboid protease GluP
MDAETARIPARSRREAMDWSLVLLSQGIEPVIDFDEGEAGWGLLVPGPEHNAALEAIHRYKLENRAWPWQQRLFQPGLLFDWASLAWVLLVTLFFCISEGAANLRTAGAMDSVAVAHGQWWRLFTAIWLHADLSHLAANAVFGVLLLGLAMGRYGTGAALLAAYLAGAGGNLFAGLLSPGPHHSLGASGMVMGCLGLLAVQSLTLWKQTPYGARFVIAGVAGGFMLFLLLGLSPGSDLLAHLGGFLSGLVLGAFLTILPNLAHRGRLNLLFGLMFAALVIWPWWRALSEQG